MTNKIQLIQVASIALITACNSLNALSFTIRPNNGSINAGTMVSSGSIVNAQSGSRDTLGTNSGGTSFDLIYAFQLPDLAGETINSIDFSFTVGTVDGNRANLGPVDLVGLRISSNRNVTTGDYGANGEIRSDNVFDNTIATGDRTSLGNLSSLRTWLSGNYVAGNYVILAFQLDTEPGVGGTRYRIDNGPLAPVLTINTVPEPATYALIFGGLALAFVSLKRRAKG